tara:strand:+ start:233 stop:634 length:402 start_codon:yes stop_codon:yes gene_type:complete
VKTIFCSSAIILNSKKECLITSRNNKTSLRDYFEFPGGKLEKNEGFEDALIRELKEELGIIIYQENLSHFMHVTHKYDDFFLYMHVYLIKNFEQKYKSVDGEKTVLVNKNNLLSINILPANKLIINKLFQFLK